jgi:hypothetical protein
MVCPRGSLVRSILALLFAGAWAARAGAVDYQAEIEPLFRKHCEKCHGADDQQSGLRLDAGAYVAQGGDRGAAIVPGKSDESLLYRAITGATEEVQAMPLDEPRLAPEEIAIIKRWIDEGASFPAAAAVSSGAGKNDHWAFQPMVRHKPPTISAMADGGLAGEWPRTAIDSFVAARLIDEGLTPSPPADRTTLIRRLSLDLRGVTPSLEELEEFLADQRPDAYERLVDRFLASEQYGERWSRHWLDLAHYADSNGFTIDGPRSIWKYRDWVIGAFNRDLPFDRFVTEQVAGDLIPGAAPDQVVATGFYRNTLVNEEGGTDKEQFRVEAVVDRVNTTGAAFLGLTVGCAQCHEHKYDPLTQREFYQLYAFFNNTLDVNELAPILDLPTPEQAAARARLTADLVNAARAIEDHDAQLAQGQAAWEQAVAAAPAREWKVVDVTQMASAERATINKADDGSLVVGGNGNIPAKDVFTLVADVAVPKITAVRLEALTNPSAPKMGPGLAEDGSFALSEFAIAATPLGVQDAAPTPLKFAAAAADWAQSGFPIEQAIDGDMQTAWAIGVTASDGPLNVKREAAFVVAQPPTNEAGWRLTFTISHQHFAPKTLLGCFRLSVIGDEVSEVTPESIRQLAQVPAADRSQPQRIQLTAAYNRTDKKRQVLEASLAQLKKQEAELTAAIPTTLVLREADKPRETRIQIRGDFLREGALVSPATPAAIVPELVMPPSPADEAPTRLDLAQWLTSPEHPLLSRVTVNRFWQHFFGLGLVETENDFGLQGSPPTHPELLDWLALEFQRRAWSVKRLHRLIVTSAVYRQSSAMTPELYQRDPRNRLLARQSRLRLEAETVRDACLSASGLLTRKLGGPGVYPPQPAGIHVLTQVTKAWPEDKGADRYRRGAYTYLWRSNLYPLLPTFDAPDATVSCSRRSRSNTPLQALTVANDPAFIEFADGLAGRLLAEPMQEGASADERRIQIAMRTCLSREPSEYESSRLLEFLQSQRKQTSDEHQAWTAVARVIMNLDEFITRE